VTDRLLGCLLDEVERDRADQHARAESHDQTDHAQAHAEEERNERADHERGARQDPPAEGRCHQPVRRAMRHPVASARGVEPSAICPKCEIG
jgi:hypothetical protein